MIVITDHYNPLNRSLREYDKGIRLFGFDRGIRLCGYDRGTRLCEYDRGTGLCGYDKGITYHCDWKRCND